MMWRLMLPILAVGVIRTNLRQRTTTAKSYTFDYSHHGEDWTQGTCASRARQSPVDFVDLAAPTTSVFNFNYEPVRSPFEITNNGQSIVADLAGRGYGGISHQNTWYNLINVNIHSQSEHTLNGVHSSMELHLVHKKLDSDALLVVAILVDSAAGAPAAEGAQADPHEIDYNPTLQFFSMGGSPQVGQRVVSMASDIDVLDLNKLMTGSFFQYSGSLTAPPCAETVSWFVKREPLRVSAAQFTPLQAAANAMTAGVGNFRTAMPLNGRPITVFHAERSMPMIPTPPPSIPIGPNPRTDREFRATKWAKDALKVATSATDYVRDLDARLRNAALAHAKALAPDLKDMMITPAPTIPPPPEPTTSPAIQAVEATAARLASSISSAANDATMEAKAAIQREAMAAATAASERAKLLVAQPPPPPPPVVANATVTPAPGDEAAAAGEGADGATTGPPEVGSTTPGAIGAVGSTTPGGTSAPGGTTAAGTAPPGTTAGGTAAPGTTVAPVFAQLRFGTIKARISR